MDIEFLGNLKIFIKEVIKNKEWLDYIKSEDLQTIVVEVIENKQNFEKQILENIRELKVLMDRVVKILDVEKDNIEIQVLKLSFTCFRLSIVLDADLSSAAGNFLAEIIFNRKNIENRKKMLLKLIEQGLNINYHNSKGENLLHLFIHYHVQADDSDAVEITQILLDAGISLNDVTDNYKEYSPLFLAIKSNNIQLVSFFLQKGADINKARSIKISPLHQAVKRQNMDIVELLVSNGADIHAQNEWNETPLFHACDGRNEKIISFLLQKGADISLEDIFEGDTPFARMLPCYGDNLFPACCVMIQQIAKLKSFDDSFVNKLDMEIIQKDSRLLEYFEKCENELDQMARTKFYPPYSYYCILKMHKNIKKLANLTKNKEFEKNFIENLNGFPHYKNDLVIIFNEAVAVKEENLIVRSRLESIFCDLFPDIVIRELALKLTVKDLPIV